MLKRASFNLTRRCYLHCDYCRFRDIDYSERPDEYIRPTCNEKEVEHSFWIELAGRLKSNNPNIHIYMKGGEPFLYKKATYLFAYMNILNINYTIESGCCGSIEEILINFSDNKFPLKNLTLSVDSGFHMNDAYSLTDDSLYRATRGVDVMSSLINEGLIINPVCNVVLYKGSERKLYKTISFLNSKGISCNIVFLEYAKNRYYDFSALNSDDAIIENNEFTRKFFRKIFNSRLNINMKKSIPWNFYDNFPSNFDCGVDKDFTDISIDFDGTVRLCDRIRGVHNINALDLVERDGLIKMSLLNNILEDKKSFCKGCGNWMISK